jgi:hypothetical protein
MVAMADTRRLAKVSRRLTHQAMGEPRSKLMAIVQAASLSESFMVDISAGERDKNKTAT